MDPIEPKIAPRLLPEGTKAVTYAEDQPEYLTLPTLKTLDGRVVSAWQPNAGELELLKLGVPIYLTLHTFHYPLQPIMLTVGEPDLRGSL